MFNASQLIFSVYVENYNGSTIGFIYNIRDLRLRNFTCQNLRSRVALRSWVSHNTWTAFHSCLADKGFEQVYQICASVLMPDLLNNLTQYINCKFTPIVRHLQIMTISFREYTQRNHRIHKISQLVKCHKSIYIITICAGEIRNIRLFLPTRCNGL